MDKKENGINIDLLNSMMINIVKPTIKEYYYEKNKPLMDEWQGNCCAQTAVIVANIMKSSIQKLGYEIKAFHGEFIDMIQGNQVEYNHCWVYCRNVSDNNKSVLIDIARTQKQDIVMLRNSNSYDKTISGYEFQYIKSYQEIDYTASLDENEYFTSHKGSVSYNEILKRISNQKLLKTK
jgi:hypothetical protein